MPPADVEETAAQGGELSMVDVLRARTALGPVTLIVKTHTHSARARQHGATRPGRHTGLGGSPRNFLIRICF